MHEKRHHHSHAKGAVQARKEIKVVEAIMGENDRVAAENREWFESHGIFTLNLMSSPGAGKTTLLEKTLPLLRDEFHIGVIEGDIYTTADADRLKPAGVDIVQINTGPFGGDCHLSAAMIRTALDGFDPHHLDLLFIENVGNLVCPAEFELGVKRDVAVLSLPEGEDKPLKYPLLFRKAHLMLLSKIDLEPHLDFRRDALEENVKKINPHIRIIPVSARTGEGISEWVEWIRAEIAAGERT